MSACLRTTRAVLVVAALAVLPACGDDPAPPTTLPPITSSPTPAAAAPTPSVTAATPATTPGQINEATQAEAEAFVEEFWGVVNAGLTGKGTAEALEAFYLASCGACREIHADVVEATMDGQYARGGTQDVVETRFETNEGPVVLVMSAVQPQPGKLFDASGEVVDEVGGGPVADFVFTLVRTREGWKIQDLLPLGPRS